MFCLSYIFKEMPCKVPVSHNNSRCLVYFGLDSRDRWCDPRKVQRKYSSLNRISEIIGRHFFYITISKDISIYKGLGKYIISGG